MFIGGYGACRSPRCDVQFSGLAFSGRPESNRRRPAWEFSAGPSRTLTPSHSSSLSRPPARDASHDFPPLLTRDGQYLGQYGLPEPVSRCPTVHRAVAAPTADCPAADQPPTRLWACWTSPSARIDHATRTRFWRRTGHPRDLDRLHGHPSSGCGSSGASTRSRPTLASPAGVHCVCRVEGPGSLVTGGGFHRPVRASDFGA